MIENKNTLRTFGYIWSFIFFLISYFNNFNSILLAASLLFLISSTFFPTIYVRTHIFQLWVKFGNFIGHINSKIIIFILFFFIFTPIGILLKIFRKDLLKKKLDKNKVSYFEKRQTQPGTMINQF